MPTTVTTVTLADVTKASPSSTTIVSSSSGEKDKTVVVIFPHSSTTPPDKNTWSAPPVASAIVEAMSLHGAHKTAVTVTAGATSYTPTVNELITELLTTTHALSSRSHTAAISNAAYAALTVVTADAAVTASSIQAAGVLRLQSGVTGTFMIQEPSVRASIVLIITVGGLKVTVIFRW